MIRAATKTDVPDAGNVIGNLVSYRSSQINLVLIPPNVLTASGRPGRPFGFPNVCLARYRFICDSICSVDESWDRKNSTPQNFALPALLGVGVPFAEPGAGY